MLDRFRRSRGEDEPAKTDEYDRSDNDDRYPSRENGKNGESRSGMSSFVENAPEAGRVRKTGREWVIDEWAGGGGEGDGHAIPSSRLHRGEC